MINRGRRRGPERDADTNLHVVVVVRPSGRTVIWGVHVGRVGGWELGYHVLQDMRVRLRTTLTKRTLSEGMAML
jgi:hypothetical protein